MAPKPRAGAFIEHANVLARSGHDEQAIQLAVEALAIGRRYRSERTISRVQQFRQNMPKDSADVPELDEHLAELYNQGNP